MHLHKAFRAEFVTSLLIAAFGRAQLSVSPLPPPPGDHGPKGRIWQKWTQTKTKS